MAAVAAAVALEHLNDTSRDMAILGPSIRTPLFELRYANHELLQELSTVAGDVIPPGSRPFDGDATFYDLTPAGRRRQDRSATITDSLGRPNSTSARWMVSPFDS